MAEVRQPTLPPPQHRQGAEPLRQALRLQGGQGIGLLPQRLREILLLRLVGLETYGRLLQHLWLGHEDEATGAGLEQREAGGAGRLLRHHGGQLLQRKPSDHRGRILHLTKNCLLANS